MNRLDCIKGMAVATVENCLPTNQLDEDEELILISVPADLDIQELSHRSIIMEGTHKIKKTGLQSTFMEAPGLRSVLSDTESETLVPGPALRGMIKVTRTFAEPPPVEDEEEDSEVVPPPRIVIKEDFPVPGWGSPKRESSKKRKKDRSEGRHEGESAKKKHKKHKKKSA